jgi:hypothetical protein
LKVTAAFLLWDLASLESTCDGFVVAAFSCITVVERTARVLEPQPHFLFVLLKMPFLVFLHPYISFFMITFKIDPNKNES